MVLNLLTSLVLPIETIKSKKGSRPAVSAGEPFWTWKIKIDIMHKSIQSLSNNTSPSINQLIDKHEYLNHRLERSELFIVYRATFTFLQSPVRLRSLDIIQVPPHHGRWKPLSLTTSTCQIRYWIAPHLQGYICICSQTSLLTKSTFDESLKS